MTYQLATAKVWNGTAWVAAAGGSALSFPQQIQASAAVNVTASASPHTKGAWFELIASTTAAADWIDILTINSASGIDTSSLIDIGIGAAGSETVLIANMVAGYTQINSGFWSPALLPIRIPAGSRISARSQSVISSRNVPTKVVIASGTATSPTSVDTLGAVTASSRGTNLPTSNTYVQIVASTSRAYQAILMMPTGGGSASTASESSTYTLGIGAAGSETAVMVRACGSSAQEQVGIATNELNALYVGNVPAGSRLAVKQSVGRTYRDVILYGVPA